MNLIPLPSKAPVACEGFPNYSGAVPASDPSYSSLYLKQPQASDNLLLVQTGPAAVKPEFALEWDYHDVVNAQGRGISNIIMEFVQHPNDTAGYQSAGAFAVNSSSLSTNCPYAADTVDREGLWCTYCIARRIMN